MDRATWWASAGAGRRACGSFVPAGTWHTRHRVGGMETDRGFLGNRVIHCLTVQLASFRGGRGATRPGPEARPPMPSQRQQGRGLHLLGGGEGHLKVLAPVLRAELPVVKGLGEEVVHQRAEGHAVAPTRGKVLDVHVLRGGGRIGQTPPPPAQAFYPQDFGIRDQRGPAACPRLHSR